MSYVDKVASTTHRCSDQKSWNSEKLCLS